MTHHTFGQALDEANKLDAEAGTEHRGDAVICAMLEHISAKRTRTLTKSTTANKVTRQDSGSQAPRSGPGQVVGSHKGKKAPAQFLAKSRIAAAPAASKKQPQPLRGAWSSAQVAAALDDGVKRGRISGSAAVAAMKAFESKR